MPSTLISTYAWRLCRLALTLALLAAALLAGQRTQAAPADWRALTSLLPAHTQLSSTAISPDSQFVVFRADVETDNLPELYSVPLAGGAVVKLNPDLVDGGEVSHEQITPDSSYVLYIADQEVDQRAELYRVPIGGGPAVKLSGPLVNGGNVGFFRIDADTQQVVYTADQETNDVWELFSVPLSGGTPVKLNPPMTTGGDIFQFQIDPAGDRVVYNADQDTNDLAELYSAPIAGGTAVKLNNPVAEGIYLFRLTPGNAWVAYLAREVGASATELFINSTSGGDIRNRNYTLGPGENVKGFAISPDAVHMAYVVGTTTNLGSLWLTHSFVGSTSLRLSEIPDAGWGVFASDFAFTSDSERVVFGYQPNATSPRKLQSATGVLAPVDRVDLFTPQPDYQITGSQLSPDGQWAVVTEVNFSTGDTRLLSVPVGGGAAVYLGASSFPRFTPDSSRVIFRDYSVPDRYDLMSIQIFGGGLRNLSRVRAGENAFNATVSPNGQWIVFGVDLASGEKQLRVSDGTEAQIMYDLFLPLVRR